MYTRTVEQDRDHMCTRMSVHMYVHISVRISVCMSIGMSMHTVEQGRNHIGAVESHSAMKLGTLCV